MGKCYIPAACCHGVLHVQQHDTVTPHRHTLDNDNQKYANTGNLKLCFVICFLYLFWYLRLSCLLCNKSAFCCGYSVTQELYFLPDYLQETLCSTDCFMIFSENISVCTPSAQCWNWHIHCGKYTSKITVITESELGHLSDQGLCCDDVL